MRLIDADALSAEIVDRAIHEDTPTCKVMLTCAVMVKNAPTVEPITKEEEHEDA